MLHPTPPPQTQQQQQQQQQNNQDTTSPSPQNGKILLLRNNYNQKALQQIRNSLQPYHQQQHPHTQTHTPLSQQSPSSSRCSSSLSSTFIHTPSSTNRSSPVDNNTTQRNGGRVEYRMQEFPFVPSQVPPSVQMLLTTMNTTSLPTSTLCLDVGPPPPQQQLNRDKFLIKSQSVEKPILQQCNDHLENDVAPPLPPKPPPLLPRCPHEVWAVGGELPPKKNKNHHQSISPIPMRRNLSKMEEKQRLESKIKAYPPTAYKFFMEQHIENILKSHTERQQRRLQLESEMAKIGLSDEAQTQMRRMLSQKESNYIRLKRAKMDKSMFRILKIIGVGAFGEVSLVEKKQGGGKSLYAMKTLRKRDVLRRKQVAHVKAERDILAEADNEWVVKLYYSFQDLDNLYFVMDYIPGGDLMSLLIKKGIFEEELARFYIAELTYALESVHKMGFIHRDIKPDNILIDRDGHIKLTDFGLCTGFRWTHDSKYYNDNSSSTSPHSSPTHTPPPSAMGVRQTPPLPSASRHHNQTPPPPSSTRQTPPPPPPQKNPTKKHNKKQLAHSLVGTPNYIAPEVLLRQGYSQLCDWWSVGVILYEMLVGQPPFLANSPAETQYKVINWERSLQVPPQTMSPPAKDLILKLCTDQSRRFGKNPGEIKTHPFLHPLLLTHTHQNQNTLTPPYLPCIRHPTDTSNFDVPDDEIDEDDEYNNNNEENNDNEDDEAKLFHGFYEFTFRRFFDDVYFNNNNNDNNSHGPVYV